MPLSIQILLLIHGPLYSRIRCGSLPEPRAPCGVWLRRVSFPVFPSVLALDLVSLEASPIGEAQLKLRLQGSLQGGLDPGGTLEVIHWYLAELVIWGLDDVGFAEEVTSTAKDHA